MDDVKKSISLYLSVRTDAHTFQGCLENLGTIFRVAKRDMEELTAKINCIPFYNMTIYTLSRSNSSSKQLHL